MRAECELRRTRAGNRDGVGRLGWTRTRWLRRRRRGCGAGWRQRAEGSSRFRPPLFVSGSPGGFRLFDRLAEPICALFLAALLWCERSALRRVSPCSGAYIRSDQNGTVGPAYHVLLR